MRFREFHNSSRTGKIRVWKIRVDGKSIHTEWGELGGQMQKGHDLGEVKNAGRVNEVSAEEDAQNRTDRLIREKEREGYVELGGGQSLVDEIDWSQRLPESLSFYKPDNTLSPTLMRKLERGDVLFTRKRDGEAQIVRTHEHREVAFYSRRMHRYHHLELGGPGWEARYPGVVEEVRSLDLPPDSVLLGEMVHGRVNDDRWKVGSVVRATTEKALDLQAEEGPLRYYVWDFAFLGGHCLLTSESFETRYGRIVEMLEGQGFKHLLPIEIYSPEDIYELAQHAGPVLLDHEYGTPVIPKDAPKLWRQAVAVALQMGWEGFVVVDPEEILGDKAYNLRGKTYRPSAASGKLKPFFEDDFIAVFDPDGTQDAEEHLLPQRGSWGKGKRLGTVGAVSLYQYNSKDELVYICECGGGIDDAFSAEYSDPAKYPLVVEVRYETRSYEKTGGKTNALQFPRIVRVRDDKDMDECINERL